MSGTATTAADAAAIRLGRVILHGIASAVAGDIEIWPTTRAEAEVTLAEILRDEA